MCNSYAASDSSPLHLTLPNASFTAFCLSTARIQTQAWVRFKTYFEMKYISVVNLAAFPNSLIPTPSAKMAGVKDNKGGGLYFVLGQPFILNIWVGVKLTYIQHFSFPEQKLCQREVKLWWWLSRHITFLTAARCKCRSTMRNKFIIRTEARQQLLKTMRQQYRLCLSPVQYILMLSLPLPSVLVLIFISFTFVHRSS